MLQAMLHGKLTRPEEGKEDLLTSNTFGLIKYMPEELVLLPFLSGAWNPLTKERLATMLNEVVGISSWRFWPYLSHQGCENCVPDVEVIFRNADGSRTCLLVEAKYQSGKSSFASASDAPPNDQLAREFDNLSQMAQASEIARYCVVYITADYDCPTAEIDESASEFRSKRGYDPAIYWLSWRYLPTILELPQAQSFDITIDLLALLRKMELTTFYRLRFADVRRPKWQLQKSKNSWAWFIPSLQWTFEKPAQRDVTPSEPDVGSVGGLVPNYSWQLPHRPDQIFHWKPL